MSGRYAVELPAAQWFYLLGWIEARRRPAETEMFSATLQEIASQLPEGEPG